jgi:hypothetical protein
MAMPREEPKNPLVWYLVQVVEYVVVIALVGRMVPESTPRWIGLSVGILAIVGVFLLNYFVIMPNIGQSSRTGSNDDDL